MLTTRRSFFLSLIPPKRLISAGARAKGQIVSRSEEPLLWEQVLRMRDAASFWNESAISFKGYTCRSPHKGRFDGGGYANVGVGRTSLALAGEFASASKRERQAGVLCESA